MNKTTSTNQPNYELLRKKYEKLNSMVATIKKLEDLIDEAKIALIKSQTIYK